MALLLELMSNGAAGASSVMCMGAGSATQANQTHHARYKRYIWSMSYRNAGEQQHERSYASTLVIHQ